MIRFIEFPCESCGARFTAKIPRPSSVRRFCSPKCRASYRHSKEHMLNRFWSQVKRGDGCWPWIGAKRKGYGSVRWDGKAQFAHRVSWMLANGNITGGLWVLHKCDNPPCVRPDHLFLGTALDNARDAIQKGRMKYGNVRFSEQEVREMRRLRGGGLTLAEIASRYRTVTGHISRICRRVNWARVQ